MLAQMMAVAEGGSVVQGEECNKACEMVDGSFSKKGDEAKVVARSSIESQRSSF